MSLLGKVRASILGGKEQRVLNDFQSTTLSHRLMIWLLPRPIPPLPVSKLDWWHTGRLRKRDVLPILERGERVGEEPNLWWRESLVLYKSFSTLWEWGLNGPSTQIRSAWKWYSTISLGLVFSIFNSVLLQFWIFLLQFKVLIRLIKYYSNSLILRSTVCLEYFLLIGWRSFIWQKCHPRCLHKPSFHPTLLGDPKPYTKHKMHGSHIFLI